VSAKMITCKECGQPAPYRGTQQKYCVPCSDKKNRERHASWARAHPLTPSQKQASHVLQRARIEKAREAGRLRSQGIAESIAWLDGNVPYLKWLVRVAVPFGWELSKNHIYALTGDGHVALRQESNQMRGLIATLLRRALAEAGVNVVQNKVWLDIFVQKPNHKGDAVNVIDLVCDAVKDAIGLDDRWFCIRRLDWEIVKENGRVFIGVGQEDVENVQVCSYCGQLLPLTTFTKYRSRKLGVGRECKECRALGRKLGAKSIGPSGSG
jgi:hypothetical protein